MPTKKSNTGTKSQKNLNAYKKLFFADDGAQEVEVHTSLPPCVQGEPRGCLKVSVQAVRWEYSIGPPAPKLCLRLKWWGEQSRGTIFRVPAYAGSDGHPASCSRFAYFPIRTSIQQLRTYLKDMGPVSIDVGLGHLSDSSMVIGQVTIPALGHLSASTPVEGQYPVVSPQGIEFGKVAIHFSLEKVKASSRQCKAPPESELQVGLGTDSLPKDTSSKKAAARPPVDLSCAAPAAAGCDSKGAIRHIAAPVKPQATTKGQAAAETRDVKLSSGTGSTVLSLDGGPALELSERARSDVIADLIQRGRKLRESMLQAVVQASLVGTDASQHSPSLGHDKELEFSESCTLLNQHTGVPRKLSGFPTDDIVALLAGNVGIGSGLRATDSSDDEFESVDISCTEADHYLLEDAALLGTLLYTEQLKDTEQATSGEEAQPPSDPLAVPRDPAQATMMAGGTDMDQAKMAGGTDMGQAKMAGGTDMDQAKMAGRTNMGQAKMAGGTDMDQAKMAGRTDMGQAKMAGGTDMGQAKMAGGTDMGQAKMAGGTDMGQAKMVDKASHTKGSIKTDESISSLASFFSSGQKSAESAVLRSIGIERLTRLGRVTSVRVIVERLKLETIGVEMVKSRQKNKKLSKAPSATYFVEYHFPLTLSANKSSRGKSTCSAGSGELVRMASRQANDGVVVFSHCSVFPVTFCSSQVVQQWWSNVMVLRVYSKSSEERMPFLLGKAMLPLKLCLTANQLRSSFVLDVKASSQGTAMKETTRKEPVSSREEPITSREEPVTSREEPIIGNLEVSFQFVIEKGQQQEEEVLPPISPEEEEEEEEKLPIEHVTQKGGPLEQKEEPVGPRGLPTDKSSTVLQLLLFIPEGMDISVPSSGSCSKPNPYLVCKLFCVSPHSKTAVHWSTSNPLFGFKEVYPLHLTSSLLEKLCNKFVVVEVWHKTPGTTTEDELIGLVKLSVHQFYVAFADQSSVDFCLSAELPVIAVDVYSPIINPFSGAHCGYLAVLLAMGKTSQLLQVQRQLAAGTYVLQPPYSISRGEHLLECQKGQRAPEFCTEESSPNHTAADVDQASHTIEICVGGVRQLSAFSNTVWGEADCYVQYHFPSLCDQDLEEDAECTLQPYCTGTALCVPEPTFNHTTKHTLNLSADFPLQKVLIKACGSKGGIPFELWRRFYYPNIRDQLIAKASLPLAKLCAMVTMQRATPSAQSFALPLKLVIDDSEATSGGILDVCASYHCSVEPPVKLTGHHERVSINLALGVLRCTGLKDAAKQATLGSPGPLSFFAAEAGINAYARVRFPERMVPQERRTNTIALSFTPEFSHFFDICLPLAILDDTKLHSTQIRRVPLAEVLSSGTMCIEVWHELQQSKGTLRDDKCFGRMLVTGSKDILLGCAEVPLIHLLQRHNGVCGWFALYRKGTADRYVGGVELTLSFTRGEEDRELVLSHAAHLGWKPPATVQLPAGDPCAATQQKLRFEVTIDGVWVSVDDVMVPMAGEPSYKCCFVRYRFFSLEPVVSAPRAVTSCVEDTAVYQLNHSSKLTTMSSPQLHWYLREDPLEVQVWISVVPKAEAPRPQASDRLLGCAYIPLGDLASQCKDTPVISGNFPLFKSGVGTLHNQHLHLTVKRAVIEELKEDAPVIEIMDAPVERPPSPPFSTSEERGEGVPLESAIPQSLMDTFEVHLVVCEALHLQDGTCSEREGGPCSVYVTVQPHPSVESIVTPLVHNDGKPVWDYQFVTKIPNYYLDSACSGLEFQVWSTHQIAEGWTGEEDSYLGSAHVDLSALAYGLGQLCGWYHIVDFGQQIRGQLKVSISPTTRVRFASSHEPRYQSLGGIQLLNHVVHLAEPHPLIPSDSRTTSVLFQELRKNIEELDRVIQAKLEDRDQANMLFSSISTPSIPLPVSAVHTNHSTEVGPFRSASAPDHHLSETRALRGSGGQNHSLEHFSHPSEGQTHVSNQSEGQIHVSHPSEHQTHVSHQSEHQTHVSHQSEGQIHVSHQSEGLIHVSHPSEHQTHVSHQSEGQIHVSHQSEHQTATSTVLNSSSSDSPDHNTETHMLGSLCGLRVESCSPSVSPEHCMVPGQETTSCCSTPIKSQSSTSLTSVTGSSHDDTSDEDSAGGGGVRKSQDGPGEGGGDTTGGRKEDGCPSGKVQVHADVHEAHNMKHVCRDASTTTEVLHVPAGTEALHVPAGTEVLHVPAGTEALHVPAACDTHVPYTTSFVTPQQKGETLSTPLPKGLPKGLPDFFMPPNKLEQTMRSLRAAALSRPPPRQAPVGNDTLKERRPSGTCGTKVGPQAVDDLSPAEMQRIARVFSCKPQGPPT